jgi:hypothetical protein
MRFPGPSRLAGFIEVAGVLVAVVIAGCGGSNDTSTTSAAKTAFLKKANAICAAGNRRINAANERTFGDQQGTSADVERFVEASLLPAVQLQVNQIRALAAPPGDEAEVKKMLDTAQEDIDTAKSDPELLANDQPVFKDATGLASDYGLIACSSTNFF